MSTITREKLSQIIFFAGEATIHPDPNYWLEFEKLATPGVVFELARIALERMNAKPIAYTDAEELRFPHATGDMWPVPLGHGMDLPLFTIPPAPVAIKDHQIRELVNELRDIAIEHHGTQQLRERIARTVRTAIIHEINSAAGTGGGE